MYLVCRLLSLPCSTLFPYTTLFRSPFAGPALDQPPRQARAGEPAAEAGGQRLADLLQPRMHELVDREELVALHAHLGADAFEAGGAGLDRKSTRLNSSHRCISYAVFCPSLALPSFPTRRSSDLPSRVQRSTSRRGRPEPASQRPRPAGSVSQISCSRGCMNSLIARSWSPCTRTSAPTRSKRVAQV